ncbi:MAG: hypothetical protein M3Q43_05110 [Actinomycetota bacterium]|nr:hypothetical protein [Actinomycetota bacterium]
MSRSGLPPRAPSGGAPPEVAELPGGERVALAGPAQEIARRHRAEFVDEEERYGDRGLEWCAYDNQWILAWAAADAAGFENLGRQIEWLARILDARGYPVERLARDIEIAADVVPLLRAVLESARDAVRAGGPVELSASLSHSEGDR